MSEKLAIANLSNPKVPRFHQIGNREGNKQTKSSSSNQRVLVLSTPIKSKDGTMNIGQRKIPLKMDSNQLTITPTQNKNKIISLKRKVEPAPLALPINQLNKQSTTFVKNEVGQVMGKLIPLGKFSNITRNGLAPMNIVPAPPRTGVKNSPTTGVKNLERNISTVRKNKVLKLEKKLGESPNFKEKTKPISKVETRDKIPAIAPLAIVPEIETISEQLITITDSKPKKQVRLVLKGYKNMASIGQTGTKIKLIPLDHWQMDSKSNILKTQSSGSIISQPKIVDVRSCTVDEMNGPEENKLNCNYGDDDFDMKNVLEKDPLDIGGMLSGESPRLAQLLVGNSPKNDIDLKKESESAKQICVINKPNTIRTISETGRVNSSKILTLAKGGMSVELKFDNKLKTQGSSQQKSNILLKKPIIDSKPIVTVTNNGNKVDPMMNSLVKTIKEEPGIQKIDVKYDELCRRFKINKSNVTPTETAMLAYISELRDKLSESQKSRAQALATLYRREYLANNNLSNIQKWFLELQLRNSGIIKKKHRFSKRDIVMAVDILKATERSGYSNLRKLFSLPHMSSLYKKKSKT